MRHLISLLMLLLTKLICHIFYRVKVNWISKSASDPWKNVRVFVFLNHTSLYEMLFLTAVPWSFIFKNYPNTIIPGADITMKRPMVGKFFALIFPGMIPVSRKRDDTWKNFLASIKRNTMVAIAPEGRMKRPTGLDKKGRPMTVMGGIADIITKTQSGGMLIAYSGGLHHVQIPGQTFPKLFKTIHLNFQRIEVKEFIAVCKKRGEESFKKAVQQEFQERMKKYCPPQEKK
jgi:hypothetical protein